jgi:heterodisulfide reductase subunit C
MIDERTSLSLKDFARELTAASNIDLDLTHCYGCARCSSVCKVAIFSPSDELLTPRSLLYKAIIGDQEELLRSNFIWLCSGCRRCEEICPQKVRISDVVRALRRLAFEMGRVNPLAARVNERVCMHCGACVNSCPNNAITLIETGPRGLVAYVDPSECRGCGSCSSVCSNGAIQQGILTDIEVLEHFSKR